MKKTTLVLSFLLLLMLTGCKEENKSNKITVAVSIPPQAHFVEKICGDSVDVITMIPAGASAENYELKFSDIAKFADSELYFSIGVPAEEKGILPHLSDKTKHVDLAKAVSQNYNDLKIGSSRDPHIWLSPKRAVVIVKEIAEHLSILDPENADTYKRNCYEYIKELESLESEISDILKNRKTDTFFISHPSYGYFAQDFGLEMVVLEKEGKEITPKELTEIIKQAKEQDIKHVFYQEEAPEKTAATVAGEISEKGETVKLSPLSKDYEKEMLNTAKLILEATS